MKRHYKCCCTAINSKEFNSDLYIYVAVAIINLAKFTHLTSVRKTSVFYSLNIFFHGKRQ